MIIWCGLCHNTFHSADDFADHLKGKHETPVEELRSDRGEVPQHGARPGRDQAHRSLPRDAERKLPQRGVRTTTLRRDPGRTSSF